MADDTTKRGPQDAARVNVHEPYEVRYWCEKFDVKPDQLKEAVSAVGVMSKDVAQHLGKPFP